MSRTSSHARPQGPQYPGTVSGADRRPDSGHQRRPAALTKTIPWTGRTWPVTSKPLQTG
jgi:hypothetical protein